MPKPAQVVTRVAAIIVVGGLTLGVCLAALIPGARQIALAHHYTSTVRTLGDLSEPTTVYDAAGNQIGKLGVQDREPAELSEVPQILINAVIATEDKTFWKNPGIDVGGVSRAFVDNLDRRKDQSGRVDDHAAAGEEPDPRQQARPATESEGARPRLPAERQVLEAARSSSST